MNAKSDKAHDVNPLFLEIRDLSVRYDKAILALDSVNFQVSEGGLVALLGPNGAGKSTLLKAIAGMLPFEQGEIYRGEISFEGERLDGRYPAAIARRGIALVQEGRECFRHLTVTENLKAAGFIASRKSLARLTMVYEYFPMLKEMNSRRAGVLSGGQLQMLVIGMAFMTQARLVLLDEPTLGLSPVAGGAVFDAVKRLHDELGVTLVVAEPTVSRLFEMATDVYILRNGHVVAHAPPSDIGEARLQQVYLGH